MLDVKSLTITLILVFVVYKLIRRDFDLLDAFVVLLPFKIIGFEIGLSIYAFQVPLLLLGIQKTFSKNNLNIFIKNEIYLIFFLIYITFSTFIISNFFISDYIENTYYDSFFRGEGRYLSILFKMLFLEFGSIYLIYSAIKNENKLKKVVKLYLFSLISLSLLGIIQVVLSVFIGTDIFPIRIDESGQARLDLVTNISGTVPFVRLTSLGGEPKGIASSLSVGIMLLAFLNRQKIELYKSQKYSIWLFMLCILLSLSTSGFGLLFILLIIFVLTGVTKQKFWRVNIRTLLVGVILVVFTTFSWNILSGIFQSRILDRTAELANEEVDEIILQFLKDNPNWAFFGSGSGNIHNLVSKLLSGQSYASYLDGNIFVSRYGYMKLISENGLIGFSLFIIAFGNILVRLYKPQDSLTKVFFGALITMIAFFFARSNYVLSELMFVSGLALAHLALIKKNRIQQL